MRIKLRIENTISSQLKEHMVLYEQELTEKGNENIKIGLDHISFKNRFITYQSRMNVFSSIKEGSVYVQKSYVTFYYKSRRLPLYIFIVIIITFILFKTSILFLLSIATFLMYVLMNIRTYISARLWLKRITSRILEVT